MIAMVPSQLTPLLYAASVCDFFIFRMARKCLLLIPRCSMIPVSMTLGGACPFSLLLLLIYLLLFQEVFNGAVEILEFFTGL